jgi:hypothetical protein
VIAAPVAPGVRIGRAFTGRSSPVAPREDIAAGPAFPSPSKGVTAVKPQAACAWAGSANQKTRWSTFARTRVPLTTVLTKASAMMPSTLSDPMPAALVVKSAIYSTAPKGGVAKASAEVRKTAKSVLVDSPRTSTCRVSTPRVSSLWSTVTFPVASGRQLATAADAGTKRKLMVSSACATPFVPSRVNPRVTTANDTPDRLMACSSLSRA